MSRARSSAWRVAMALSVPIAIAMASCTPGAGTPSLEVYLRSDLSAAERADVRFVVHVESRGSGSDAIAPLEVDAETLSIEQLADSQGALLGQFPELMAGRYEVSIDLVRESAAAVRVDVAALEFRGNGAQQIVFLLLRDGVVPCDEETPCAEAPCATSSCIEGACFTVRTSDWSDACECDVDGDCPAASGCGASECADHTCRVTPDDTRCGASESCGDDLVCDPVTCRGRAAGDECRPASSACDAPEVCPSADGECPPDASLEVGAGCLDDDTAIPGFCTVREGTASLVCDTRCEAGRACQLGCLAGIQVCLPTPRCDTSGGDTATDGTVCGVAELCRAAPSCASGVCTLGTPTVDAVCGEDPAPDCVAAPRCDAAGACVPRPAPMGTACTGIGSAMLCYAFSCSAAGVCLQTPIPSDPRCARSVYDDCAAVSCSPERTSSRWGCNPQPDSDVCARDYCDSVTRCEFTNTMDRGPFYQCQDWGEYRCRRIDGSVVGCGADDPPGLCDLEAQCNDGARNGSETDIDCGGQACSRLCESGQMCAMDIDCFSGCVGGACL